MYSVFFVCAEGTQLERVAGQALRLLADCIQAHASSKGSTLAAGVLTSSLIPVDGCHQTSKARPFALLEFAVHHGSVVIRTAAFLLLSAVFKEAPALELRSCMIKALHWCVAAVEVDEASPVRAAAAAALEAAAANCDSLTGDMQGEEHHLMMQWCSSFESR
jgi:hypothetical protein